MSVPKFMHDPEVTYLNHGSFGGCPEEIFDHYLSWQRRLEAEPVRYIISDAWDNLLKARKSLSDFVGCDKDDIVLVTNPTTALNIYVKSLDLHPGDEVLTTNLEYGACDRTWQYYCQKVGAKYVAAEIKLPVVSKEEIIEQIFSKVTPATKFLFFSEIISSTAFILPANELIAEAKKRGLITIVDGAHTPGHIDLDISNLDPDVYIGACHKWMNGPKGVSFLYVRKELQESIDPLIVSWGYNAEQPSHSQFLDYHQMQGTRDFSAFLSLPFVIDFFQKNKWWEQSDRAKKMIIKNYEPLCDLMNTKPICPISNEFLGQMCSVPLNIAEPMSMWDFLFNKYKIEIPVSKANGQHYLRLSLNAYNTQDQVDYLMKVIEKEFF